MDTMASEFCCGEMDGAIQQSGTQGYGVLYVAGKLRELPRFFLEYRHGPESRREIKFCPWCGRDFSTITTL
jgi:hypothetical protein